MIKRAGADVTGQAGGTIGGAADCAQAGRWIARMIPNAKIHLEAVRKVGVDRVTSRICSESRRERRAYPLWSVRSEQRRDRLKFAVTLWAEVFLPWGGVARSCGRQYDLCSSLSCRAQHLLAPRQKSFRRDLRRLFGQPLGKILIETSSWIISGCASMKETPFHPRSFVAPP